jgi:hypothetical protein
VARTPLEHPREQEARQDNGRTKIDLEPTIDVRHFEVGQQAAHRNTCVRDQDVDRSGLGRQPLGLAAVSQVRDDDTGADQLAGQQLQLGLAAGTEHEPDAFSVQAAGYDRAYP